MHIVDPVKDPRWAALHAGTAGGTIFSHPAWLRLLQAQYGYDMAGWCLGGENGRLTAGLAVARIRSRLTGTRLVSVPFSDVTPPLIDEGSDPEALGVAVASERARTGLDLEVRGALPGPGAQVVERFVQHRLALGPDVEAVRKGCKSQVRRGIAKATREGVTVQRRTDADALARFYALHLRTRRHQGMPTQPKRFILRFADLFAAGLGFVLLVRHHNRDVAAAVFLAAGDTVSYKYGASDRRALGVRPNNLLFMEAIEWGCRNGARVLDFGRTDFANEGLRAFKRSWGAEETVVHYTYFADRVRTPVAGPAGRALAEAIRRGPPGFGRLVGEALYRHMG